MRRICGFDSFHLLFLGFQGMGLWDCAVSKQNLAELEDVLWWLPAPTKLKLIGLHLIQTCRNTVPVTSRHNGFEDFAGTSGSLHNGSLSQWERWQGLRGVGRACSESAPLVLTLLCVCETGRADLLEEWGELLCSCHRWGAILYTSACAILTCTVYRVFWVLYSYLKPWSDS